MPYTLFSIQNLVIADGWQRLARFLYGERSIENEYLMVGIRITALGSHFRGFIPEARHPFYPVTGVFDRGIVKTQFVENSIFCWYLVARFYGMARNPVTYITIQTPIAFSSGRTRHTTTTVAKVTGRRSITDGESAERINTKITSTSSPRFTTRTLSTTTTAMATDSAAAMTMLDVRPRSVICNRITVVFTRWGQFSEVRCKFSFPMYNPDGVDGHK